MSGIEEWLKARDLAHLTQVFLDNEIGPDILLDLNDDDLREMGLTLGARKRLRSAIDLAQEQGGETATAGNVSVTGAERRHLTIMFIDLVGSTALSQTLDPEDLRAVITNFQNVSSGVVTRYKGQVAKYMGDGVLCYFGWPRAHEDDAERSARAALEIADAVAQLSTPNNDELAVRVGIATGLVVVGDLIGEGAAQEEAVVGATPNLAARLQQAASPGEIVIADSTRQLLGDGFETLKMGELDLKGFDASTTAHRVLSERSLLSRYESHAYDPRLPMVGREHELGLVLDRWSRACGSEGQATVLIGEAGIGKSRLTQAVIEAVQETPHFRVSYHCSPYHTDSSFFPVIQQLTHLAGITATDSAQDRRDKLGSKLRVADPALVAELIQTDGTAGYGALDLSPQQFRNKVLDAMSDEIRALSREKPVLFVVEDAHWIDASTLASLETSFDKIASERVLILITARPTFVHGFGGHPIVSRLTLNRLGVEQTTAVLTKITGGKTLPDELVREIAARTDGVPLFIEELTKTILESGELRETETSYELTGPISRVTIPATLHDSLMARIDRLQPVKEIAQIAACIGREFDRTTLLEIAQVDERTLDDALSQLEDAELLFRRGMATEARYVFKHALVRDVAYESLLKTRRQNIHRRLYDFFEADEEAAPELAAHHATEAGLTQQAVLGWERAGTLAQARPAYSEAANHLKMALRTAEGLLDQPEWAERHLRLLVQLSQIYLAKEGYSSSEASQTYALALERIDATQSSELQVAIYYGTWISPYMGARLKTGLDIANRLVTDMEKKADTIPRLISHRMRAANLIGMGRSPEALRDLDIAFDLYQSVDLTDFASKFAQDPGVQIWCYQLLALWMTGDHDRAITLGRKAVERGHLLKHANTFCYAGLHDVTLSIWHGDAIRAREINDQMRALAIDHDMSLWKVFCDLHDQVIGCMEDNPNAVRDLPHALDDYIATGGGLWKSLYRAEHAKALVRAGDIMQAQAVIDAAFAEIEDSGEHWADAELFRTRGEALRQQGNPGDADAAFRMALNTARKQGARALELRAATSLAQAAEPGRRCNELVAALSWFGDDQTSPDLCKAREIMAQSGAQP